MASDIPLLSLDHLSKRYPGTAQLALDGITLQVGGGEVYGFLGANGAGKSTTIRTILNFIQPTAGTAQIAGYDSARESVEAKRHVGYLAGDVALYGRMTGRELLDYLGELSGEADISYRQELVSMFEAQLDQPITELSKGNRQKVGLIQAVMHRPDVLILDEPTSGLDPLMQEQFFSLIKASKQRGAAVFMSSHNFGEVQRTCDRIGIIRAGKLVKEQAIGELDGGGQHFTVTFAGKPPEAELSLLKQVQVTRRQGQTLHLTTTGDLSPLLSLLSKKHVTQLTSQAADLEQEFLQFYGEQEV